ncbi:hypothetical protein Afil01_07710 [Actinorhabdospora filicis]|uniref:Uncharacterized protein n=1 Tax=Actinorhabdospora filicis TaxID=1785913 RepID=A0A9W6W6W5_9ACTN|nr:hypothetical protein Afil01_07710 [Actinorhabdospora filicis]
MDKNIPNPLSLIPDENIRAVADSFMRSWAATKADLESLRAELSRVRSECARRRHTIRELRAELESRQCSCE